MFSNCYNGLVYAALTKSHPRYFKTFAEIESIPRLRPLVINPSWKAVTYAFFNDTTILFNLAERYLEIPNGIRDYDGQAGQNAIAEMLEKNIPFVIHGSYNDKWRSLYYPLPLTDGDEKIFWILVTKFPINKESKFRNEIYSCLQLFYEIGLYQFNKELSERMHKRAVKDFIRQLLLLHHSLDREFSCLTLSNVRPVFEFFGIGLIVCVCIKIIEYYQMKSNQLFVPRN